MGAHCDRCEDNYLVGCFRRGNLVRLYVQHQHSSKNCRGDQTELDVAEWLRQIPVSDVAGQVQRGQAEARTRGTGAQTPRRSKTSRIPAGASPRVDRTSTGRPRSR